MDAVAALVWPTHDFAALVPAPFSDTAYSDTAYSDTARSDTARSDTRGNVISANRGHHTHANSSCSIVEASFK
jgi:hypothetical protein